jgi:hypothetical protein
MSFMDMMFMMHHPAGMGGKMMGIPWYDDGSWHGNDGWLLMA